MNIAPGQKRYLNTQYLGQGLPDKDISFSKYKTPLLHCAAEKKNPWGIFQLWSGVNFTATKLTIQVSNCIQV